VSDDSEPEVVCRVCGGKSGSFRRVTFVGAPTCGIPVHRACVLQFFKQLDEDQSPRAGTLSAMPPQMRRERRA
jgi:hypothetical protein